MMVSFITRYSIRYDYEVWNYAKIETIKAAYVTRHKPMVSKLTNIHLKLIDIDLFYELQREWVVLQGKQIPLFFERSNRVIGELVPRVLWRVVEPGYRLPTLSLKQLELRWLQQPEDQASCKRKQSRIHRDQSLNERHGSYVHVVCRTAW